MAIPADYAERVYAGVLGKIIGVYLGRPFEGWSYEGLTEKFGEIAGYVHDQLNCPLIVADDDISGTFTFPRAFADFGDDPALTPEQIGQTWLNYIIESKTILWWGGVGVSTEHTAFHRLRQGIPAPRSGSIAENGQVVAEQIGSQIFIDAWGMMYPGDPAKAADFAKRAASVSHDGEAIYGAQVVAALVAAAFVEPRIDVLLDTAVELIPRDSVIARLIADIRRWRAESDNWRETRTKIEAKYGYANYGGGCHMVPNHALIIHALVHGNGDISESLKIVNTCGWDTDCNSGNVGAILGVRNGLSGFNGGYDWRGPVADRILLPTADGGRAITDAVRETRRIVRAGRLLAGLAASDLNDSAKYGFEFAGSVQGFISQTDGLKLLNEHGDGLSLDGKGRAATPTFILPGQLDAAGYALVASPTLYSGQTITGTLFAKHPAIVRLFIRYYGHDDEPVTIDGPTINVPTGTRSAFSWDAPDTHGRSIYKIGVEIVESQGHVTLHELTWSGSPKTQFATERAKTNERQWVSALNGFECDGHRFVLSQNTVRGLVSIGTTDWIDYQFTATLSAHLASEIGVVARYQGLERYYAFILRRDGSAQLVKRYYGETILASVPFTLELDKDYIVSIGVAGTAMTAYVNGSALLTAHDAALSHGGAGLLLAEGRGYASNVGVAPAG